MKYRIWDKKLEIYRKDAFVDMNGICRHIIYYEYFDINLSSQEYTEQYLTVELSTGLFDKNGKEIYEGDVVNYSNMINPVIVFQDGVFGIVEHKRNIWQLIMNIDINNIEVIGNIHEEESK